MSTGRNTSSCRRGSREGLGFRVGEGLGFRGLGKFWA